MRTGGVQGPIKIQKQYLPGLMPHNNTSKSTPDDTQCPYNMPWRKNGHPAPPSST